MRRRAGRAGGGAGASRGGEWRVSSPQTKEPATRRDRRVAELAADAHGVLSATELHRCGLDDRAILVRVRNGRLHPLHRGVYAVGHPSITLEGHFLAAVKACGPAARLSHHAAAALYGHIAWEDRRIDVTVGTSHRHHDGIRVHRTTTLTEQDTRRHRGIPAT